jgi:tetratricopeptide (TPR) repeat protein
MGRNTPVHLLMLGICICMVGVCCASGEPNARALRYYKVLSATPSGEYVYDRFYDAWLDTGTLPELRDFLTARLQETPNVANHLLLSFYYERQRDDVQALQLYEQALARAPENADLFYLKAKTELRLNDVEAAIADLQQIEGLKVAQSLCIKAGKLLARLYARSMQVEEARQSWQRLLQRYPDDEDLYEELIELQLAEGLYDDALETSDALLARTQDSYQRIMRQLRRGDIYHYQAKKEQALAVYRSTLARVEQGSWLENQICAQIEQIFRRDDDIIGLKTYWGTLLETTPQRIGLKKRLAVALLQVGDSDKALALYREILRVMPGDQANQQAYIEALVKTNQLDRAIELLIQLRQRPGSDKELLIRLAGLYHQNNDPNATSQVLGDYLHQSEKTEYTCIRVAHLLERYQRRDKALALYHESAEAHPDSHAAREAYADALYRFDRQDQALQIWHELAQVDDLPLLLRVTQTVAMRGHSVQALAWLESRYDRYHTEITYMNRLCDLALQCKAYDRAVQWTGAQLGLARHFSQMQAAIQHIVTLCQDTETFPEWSRRVATLSAPSVQQVCLRAVLLVRSHQFDQAHALLDQVQGPGRDLALQQKIHVYRQQGLWEKAAQHTQTLVTLTGAKQVVHLRELVDLYQRAGLLDRALQWIEAWKKVAPGNTAVWLTQAGLLERQGKYREAINCLRRADTAFDGDAAVLQQLAQLYRAENRLTEAQRVYWRLYEQADDIADTLRWVRELGTTTRALKQESDVIETFQERRRNNRSSVVPCLALAELYRQTGQYEERRQALLQAARLRPRDPHIHLSMTSMLMEEDPNEALDHLYAIQPKDEALIGRFLVASCQWRPQTPEQGEIMLRNVRFVITYLRHLDDPNRAQLQWVDQIREHLSHRISLGRRRLSGLYRPDTMTLTGPMGESIRTLQGQRRHIHNRLCRVMLSIPQLAGRGFSGLHAEARARQALTEEFADLAFQAWRLTQTDISRRGHATFPSTWAAGRFSRLIHSLEYLLYQAWEKGTLPECVRRLKEAVPPERRASIAEQIDGLAQLYLVGAAEFAQAADVLVNQWTHTGQALMSFPVHRLDVRLAWVIDAYWDRALDVDLDALILKSMARQHFGYGNQLSAIVCTYMSTRIRRHRIRTEQLLERMATDFLGPKQGRQDLIDRHYQSSSRRQGSVNDRFGRCLDLMCLLAEDEALFWPVLDQLGGLTIPNNTLRHTIEGRLEEQAYNDPNRLCTFLEASPFLGEVTEFNPLPMRDLEGGSVYANLMPHLVWDRPQGRGRDDTLVTALNAYPSAFGVDFLKAHLAEDRYRAVITCLGQYWPAFQKLDPARQEQIGQVLTHTLASQTATGDGWTDSAQAAHVWFTSRQAASVVDQVTAFLEVQRIEALNIEFHRFDDYVSKLLDRAMFQDVILAKAVLLHARDLANKPQLGGSRAYDSRSLITDILGRRRNRDENPLADIGLAIALIRDANDQGVVLDRNTFYNVDRLVDEVFWRDTSGGGSKPLGMFQGLYNELGPLVGRGDASLLLTLFASCCERLSWEDMDFQVTLDWSRAQTQAGKWPGLAHLITVQLLLHQKRHLERDGRDTEGPEALPEIVQAHYRALLADQTLSLQWRLLALDMFLERIEQTQGATPLAVKGTDLLMEDWNAYTYVPSENYTTLLSRFLAAQAHPDWTHQARAVTRAYADYQQKAHAAGRGRYAHGVDLSLLEINCLLGQDERIKQQVAANNSILGQQLDAWAVLLEYDKHAILASLVQTHWQQISPQGSRGFPMDDDTRPAPALDALEREDLRYFAQVALSCLPDARQGARGGRMADSEAAMTPRAQRLVQLAQGFLGITFQSAQLEQRTLFCLIEECATLPYLEAALARQAAAIDLTSLLTTRDPLAQQTRSQLLAAHGGGAVLRGDPNSVVQIIRSLRTVTYGIRSHEVDAFRDILRWRLIAVARSIAHTWSRAQMAALATATSQLMLADTERLRHSGSDLLPSHLVFHVLGQQEAVLDQVYKRVPASIRADLFRSVSVREMFDCLAFYLSDRHLTVAQRIAIVKRFSQVDLVKQALQKGQRPGDTLLGRLRKHQIITYTEIRNHPTLIRELAPEDPRIKRFLEATRWADLSLAGKSLDQHVLELLNAPAAQDVDLSLRLLAQADAFSRDARQAGAWQGDTDESASASLLRRKRVTSLVDVGIAVALGQDTQQSAWALPPRYGSEINSRLYGLYHELGETHSNDPIWALEEFLKLLEPLFQERSAVGMAGCFVDLLRGHFRTDDAWARVMTWARGKHDSADYGSLTYEMIVAAELRQLTRAHGIRHNPKIRIHVPADHALVSHYRRSLTDESVSVMWRLLSLETLQWRKVELDMSLLPPACDLMIRGLQAYDEVPESLYAWLAHQLVTHGADDAHARQQAQALSRAYLNHAQPYRRIELSWPQRRASVIPLSTHMLELHLWAGLHQAIATQMARDADLARHPATWALLVTYQQADLFRSLVRDRLKDVDINDGSQPAFTARIEKNLAACLQGLEPGEQPYAVEVLINALSDSGEDNSKPRRSRAQRLVSLARRFSFVEFFRPDLRHRVLVWLSRECAALEPLSSILVQEVESLDLARLLRRSPEESRNLLSLKAAQCADQLIKGNPEGFIKGFELIFAGSPQTQPISDSARILWERLGSQLSHTVSYLAADWSPAQITALTAAINAYLEHVDMRRGAGLQSRMLTLHAVTHLCMGHDADRINAAAQAFSRDAQIFYKRQFAAPETLSSVCKELMRFLEEKEFPVEKRVALVKNLLQLKPVQKACEKQGGHQVLLSLLQEHRILTSEECAAYTF